MKEFTLIVSIVGWLVSRGIDKLIAKWVAYFQIAWEDRASEEAKAIFDASIHRVKVGLPERARAWEEWRNNAKTTDKA